MRIIRPDSFQIENPRLKRFIEDLYKLTTKNISFGHAPQYLNGAINNVSSDQNIDGAMVEITNTGNANTSLAIKHNLGRVPNFVDFKYKNISGDWYDAGTTWTNTQIFLKFTTANMHVRLFIH